MTADPIIPRPSTVPHVTVTKGLLPLSPSPWRRSQLRRSRLWRVQFAFDFGVALFRVRLSPRRAWRCARLLRKLARRDSTP